MKSILITSMYAACPAALVALLNPVKAGWILPLLILIHGAWNNLKSTFSLRNYRKKILSSCILLLYKSMSSDLNFIFIDTSFSMSLSTLFLTNPVCNIYKVSFYHNFVQNNCVHPFSYHVASALGSFKVKLSMNS